MQEFLDGILSRLSQEFNPEVLGDKFADLMTKLIVAGAIFVVFYFLWRLLDKMLQVVLKRANIDPTTQSFVNTAFKYTLLTIATVQALAAAGINTGAVIASLGIAGLTIGFAARDALSNLISGLLIYWDRPFVIGDLVEVGQQYGRVDKITLRSTRVVTTDGRMLAVPNTTIINSTVVSYTNFPHLRIDVSVTINVNESIDNAREHLLKLISEDPAYMTEPAPRVVVSALNDYNVELQLQVWLDDERQHVAKRFELREKIFKTFNAAGIDMPFETIQLMPLKVNVAGNQSAG